MQLEHLPVVSHVLGIGICYEQLYFLKVNFHIVFEI